MFVWVQGYMKIGMLRKVQPGLAFDDSSVIIIGHSRVKFEKLK